VGDEGGDGRGCHGERFDVELKLLGICGTAWSCQATGYSTLISL
jgi:hypothetical protein